MVVQRSAFQHSVYSLYRLQWKCRARTTKIFKCHFCIQTIINVNYGIVSAINDVINDSSFANLNIANASSGCFGTFHKWIMKSGTFFCLSFAFPMMKTTSFNELSNSFSPNHFSVDICFYRCFFFANFRTFYNQ